MEIISNRYMSGDPRLVQQLVNELKSQGIFDQFRKECFADVDTKPAYQNLRQRVEGSVAAFLKEQKWSPDMNKNQVREQLKKNIYESNYLETGVERIVDQVVNPKINTVFLPLVEDVVYKYLGIEKQQDSITKVDTNAADLLPKDLEAVSPESVNSTKHGDQKEKIDTSNESQNSKMDEDESPPFEPLENSQQVVVLQEEISLDSELSGMSGLQSHESNLASESKSSQMDWSWQDTQLSQNSSESKVSTFTSEDQKIDTNKHFAFLKNVDSDNMINSNNKVDDDTVKTDNSVESMVIEEDESTIDSQKQNKGKEDTSLDIEQKTKANKEEIKKHKERKSSETKRDDKKRSDDKKSKSSHKHSSKDDKHRKSSSSRDKDRSSSRHSSSSKDRNTKDSSSKDRDKNKDDTKNTKDKDSKTTKDVIDKDRYEKDKSKDKHNKSKDKEDEKSGKQRHDKDKNKSKKEIDKSDNDKIKTDKEKSSKDKPEKEKERGKDRGEKSKSDKSKDKTRKSDEKSDKYDKKDKDKNKSSSSNNDKSATTKDSSSLTNTKKSESAKDSKTSDKHKKDKHTKEKSSDENKDKKRDSKKDDHYSIKEKKNHRRSFDRDSNDGQPTKNTNSVNSDIKISDSQQTTTKDSSSTSFSGSGDSGNSDANEKVIDNTENTVLQNKIQPEIEVPRMKYIKPKFALNFAEAKRIMKIRRQLAILERQNQLSLADLNIVPNGLGEDKEKDSIEKENENNTNEDDDITPKNSPFRGFSRDSASSPPPKCNIMEEPKEKKSSVDLNLQSIFLSKENWEALEARLEQEMLKINFNAYESHYDDYDDNEYSSIIISPGNNNSAQNSCVIEEVLPSRRSNCEEQRNDAINTLEETTYHDSVDGGIMEETVEFDGSEEIIEEIVDVDEMNIIDELDNRNYVKQEVKKKDTYGSRRLSVKLKDINLQKKGEVQYIPNCGFNVGLEANIIEDGDESTECSNSMKNNYCTHFNKPREVVKKLHVLHKIIDKLEKDLEYSIKEYQNNVLPEEAIKIVKRGRKRKFDENVDIKNNNQLNYAKISGIQKRGRPVGSKRSMYKASIEKPCDASDILDSEDFLLPPSPAESDISVEKKEEFCITPFKQRSISRGLTPRAQRYTSDDLYKPRPVVSGTRRSKRDKNP